MTAALALAALAVVLAWPVPRVMARFTVFRRDPGPTLLAWQAVSLSAVLSAVAAMPSAVLAATGGDARLDSRTVTEHAATLAVAGTATALIVVRLLYSGHRVGTRLRSVRRRHRDLVDLVGTSDDTCLRVLAHPAPTAYCVPGRRRRVVLSEGALTLLTPDQVDAVLAHERAHLRARHDLVLEFFTVLHEAVPRAVRSDAALAEVRLLVEVLADSVAVRRVGLLPTARSLVALAGGATPEAMMGVGGASPARTRVTLLDETATPHPLIRLAAGTLTVVVLALPAALVWFAVG